MTEELPSRFGKYLLLERIALGGTSEIFKARVYGVPGFKRNVIIKRILPQYSQERAFVTMMIDEAKICSNLQHTNIVQSYELGNVEGQHYIAMEYVHGIDLAQLLEHLTDSERALPVELTCYIMSQALDGLDYAHHAKGVSGNLLGIVHRDFNPTNILISFLGEVKVTDFGIAKAIDRSSKTFTGVFKGKHGYLSPEQVLCLPLDARSDVFTAGITLWEMLAGRRMFQRLNFLGMLQQIRDADLPDLKEVAPQVPEAMRSLLKRALQKDAGDRFGSAAEFKTALDRYLDATGLTVAPIQMQLYLKEVYGEAFLSRAETTGPEEEPKADLGFTDVATLPEIPASSVPEASSPDRAAPVEPLGAEKRTVSTVRVVHDVAARVEAMLKAATASLDRGEFSKALDTLGEALENDPENISAISLHTRVKQKLLESFLAKVEDFSRVPELHVRPEECKDRNYDHRTGFVLSLVDGVVSIENLLDVSGLPPLDFMQVLMTLLDGGVIGLRAT